MSRKAFVIVLLAVAFVAAVFVMRGDAAPVQDGPIPVTPAFELQGGNGPNYIYLWAVDVDGVKFLVNENGEMEKICPCACGSPALSFTPTATPHYYLPTPTPTDKPHHKKTPQPTATPTVIPPTPTNVPPEPTVTPKPTHQPHPTKTPKPKCNQGIGNGPEGCDPGDSNHHNDSNDDPGKRGGRGW